MAERLAPANDAAAGSELIDVALESGYSPATVVELCRFFCDRDPAALTAVEAAAMIERLHAALARGLADAKLAAMVEKGLAMPDRPRARQAADTWLTRRSLKLRGG